MFNDKRISLRFISRNTFRYSSRWAEGKFSHVRVCYHVFSSQRVDFSASGLIYFAPASRLQRDSIFSPIRITTETCTTRSSWSFRLIPSSAPSISRSRFSFSFSPLDP